MKVFLRLVGCASIAVAMTGCDYEGQDTNDGVKKAPLTAGAQQAAEVDDVETSVRSQLVCDGKCPIRQWVDEERYAEAREVLTTELQSKPTDLKTVLLLATVEIFDEEYGAAYDLVQSQLPDAEEKVRLMHKRAVASLLSHDIETAYEDYTELIEEIAQTAAADPGAKVCNALTERCVPVEAHEVLEWAGMATVEYNRREIDKAETIAEDLLGMSYGGNHFGTFVLALAASKRGDDETALKRYRQILERFPKHAPSLNNIGGVYFRRDDLDSAREYYIAAYENSGRDRRMAAIAWSNVAELDMLAGRYETAEEKLHESLATSKRFAGGHLYLAVLYDILGRASAAKAHLAIGLALDEQGVTRWNTSFYTPDWETHFEALVAEHEGRNADAKQLFEELANSEVDVLRKAAERRLRQQAPIRTVRLR